MTGKNKTPVIGWHPSPPELVSRLRAIVESRGGGRGIQTAILNEALTDWLDRNETTAPESEDPQ